MKICASASVAKTRGRSGKPTVASPGRTPLRATPAPPVCRPNGLTPRRSLAFGHSHFKELSRPTASVVSRPPAWGGRATRLVARRRVLGQRDEEGARAARLHGQRLAEATLSEHRDTQPVQTLGGPGPFRTADRAGERPLRHALSVREQDLRAAALDVRLVPGCRGQVRELRLRAAACLSHELTTVGAPIRVVRGFGPLGRAFGTAKRAA